jgi:hypothetical protein
MISPQQPSINPMGELQWAQVMPAESYWRDRIAKEIEQMCVGELPQYKPCSHCIETAEYIRIKK